ncbi:Solute-binding protein family 3/N-terminal domain of MltF [Trinorchestia longiramus]|nr:Solute-binding protein family 3/N-terminal domain of MltF [Trinorchestia longiramus]
MRYGGVKKSQISRCNVVLLHKSGHKSMKELKNYRYITLADTVSKIFCGILNERMKHVLEEQRIMGEEQNSLGEIDVVKIICLCIPAGKFSDGTGEDCKGSAVRLYPVFLTVWPIRKKTSGPTENEWFRTEIGSFIFIFCLRPATSSSSTVHKQMYTFVESHWPSLFVESTQEGVDRVLEDDERYAFITESPLVQYYSARNCSLRSVGGGSYGAHSYAIAMQKNSAHLNEVNAAILQLQESGRLGQLKNKWLEASESSASCQNTGAPDAIGLGVMTLGGVFLVVAASAAIVSVLAVIEIVYRAKKKVSGIRKTSCNNICRDLCLTPSTSEESVTSKKAESLPTTESLSVPENYSGVGSSPGTCTQADITQARRSSPYHSQIEKPPSTSQSVCAAHAGRGGSSLHGGQLPLAELSCPPGFELHGLQMNKNTNLNCPLKLEASSVGLSFGSPHEDIQSRTLDRKRSPGRSLLGGSDELEGLSTPDYRMAKVLSEVNIVDKESGQQHLPFLQSFKKSQLSHR